MLECCFDKPSSRSCVQFPLVLLLLQLTRISLLALSAHRSIDTPLAPHPTLMSASASASAPAPVAVAVSASDLAAQDSGRIPPPDRSLERCHELGQASLRCQMNMQIKYNHKTQTPAVLEACRSVTWTRRWSGQDALGRGCCSYSFLFAALASLVCFLLLLCADCRTQIEEYRVCHQRQQEKRRFA